MKSCPDRLVLVMISVLVTLMWCAPVEATPSVITSNFFGGSIPTGDVIWFSSVLDPSGLGSAPVTFTMVNSQITFPGAVPNPLLLPNASVTFSPTASTCTTTFDAASNTWFTTAPSSLAGNAFLDGFAYAVPAPGLLGGVNPVTWSANFSTDTLGTSFDWKWAAAVYTSFNADPNALGVTGCDNTLLAGTPVNEEAFVTAGARGAGGTDYTGAYTASATVRPEFAPAVPDASTMLLACLGAVPLLAARKKVFFR